MSHTCPLIRGSFKKGLTVCANSYFIEALKASQSVASSSHVLAETFYQSAVWDASSGITLTVSTARVRLYDALSKHILATGSHLIHESKKKKKALVSVNITP